MILLTGSSGFIGSQLLRSLPSYMPLKINFNDRMSYLPFIRSLDANKAVTLVHCASSITVRGTTPGTEKSMNYLSEGFDFLSQLAAHCKELHILYPSSGGAIYKFTNKIPFTESNEITGNTLYTQSKICHEAFLFDLQKNHPGLKVSILRISNPYGTDVSPSRPQGIIGVALKCLIEEKPLNIFTKVDTVRDYIHLDDMTAAIHSIIKDQKPRLAFEVFNLGSGKGYSLEYVLQSIEKVFNKKISLTFSEVMMVDESPWCILNIDKIKASYDWEPKIELLPGLKKLKEKFGSI